MLVQIAIVNGVLIVGSVYLGKFLDAQMNTRLLFTVVFAVASLQFAFFLAYKLGMRAVAKTERLDPQPRASEQEHVATGDNPLELQGQQAENGAPNDTPVGQTTFSVKSS